jgi:hypothetical protein
MARTTSLLLEKARYILAMPYQALAAPAAGKIGRYMPVANCSKLVALVNIDTLAVTETVVVTAVEATNYLGAGAANIATCTCTVTANTFVDRMTITMNTPTVDDTVIINGITYTAKAAENLALRQFDQSGNTTAQALSLAACINDATWGVPGITAAPAVAVVTLTVNDPTAGGYDRITAICSDPTKAIPATLNAQALLEIDATALSGANTHVAVRVAGPATAHANVVVVQSGLNYAPMVQPVAAQDADW